MTPRRLYNFYIDPELAEGLKALKEKTGAPEAESVRRALSEYLRKQGVMKADRKGAGTRKRP
jgi:predicted DNA-binding protein